MLSLASPRTLSLAVLLVATACAPLSRQRPIDRSDLLTSAPAPAGRSCRTSELPAALPAAAELVDSAGLYADLVSLRQAGRVDAGYAVLSLAYDRYGTNIRRGLIEHDLAPAAADTLQKLVFAHRKAVPPGEAWGVRLRIDIADSVRLDVGRRELCAPNPRDRDLFTLWTDVASARDRYRPISREGTVWMRLLVDSDGSVRDAQVERGMISGSQENRLLHFIRGLSFDPALDDGIPVPGWVTLPIYVPER